MKSKALLILGIICGNISLATSNLLGAESFHPVVLWESGAEKGVILTTSTEMLVVDTKGNKLGKVMANAEVLGASFSPDGKKLAYFTSTGLWLAKLETKENYLVATGYCEYLRWNSDGMGMIFTINENQQGTELVLSKIKFLWADGDGKNLKQIYP